MTICFYFCKNVITVSYWRVQEIYFQITKRSVENVICPSFSWIQSYHNKEWPPFIVVRFFNKYVMTYFWKSHSSIFGVKASFSQFSINPQSKAQYLVELLISNQFFERQFSKCKEETLLVHLGLCRGMEGRKIWGEARYCSLFGPSTVQKGQVV